MAENISAVTSAVAAGHTGADNSFSQLSERTIKAARPGDVLKDKFVKGLHLRCFTESKSFYLYYRTKGGIQRKPKLGNYGSITLAQARKVAQEMLVEVAAGRDPSNQRAIDRDAPDMNDLWAEYWKRHGSKKKSGMEDQRMWDRALGAKFGNRKLSDIGYTDIADFMDGLKATPTQANRYHSLLSKMFNFAHKPLGWMGDNPAKGVQRYKEVKRKRYMKGEEAGRIAEALAAHKERSPASVAFIYLLILTGARKGEIAAARWDWLQDNVLHLPDSKTGAKPVYLPQQAMDVLDALPRTSGTITGILTPQKLWNTIKKEAGCPDLRLHDLRHSFASAALSAGLSLSQIGELLGHASAQTTKRYAHLVEEVAAAAATATADRIMLGMTTKNGAPRSIVQPS
jgi:integrase